MWHRARIFGKTVMLAGGSAAVILVLAFPRTTFAEEIPDSDRMGEYGEEEGMKFGNIVVKGELVADGSVPGGWTLVRTFENQSDQPEKCVLEERVLRTETMPDARVTPPPVAVVQRNQTVALGPHEKRKIGIVLSPAVGAQITAAKRRQAWVEQARARAIAAERYGGPETRATYMVFEVEYMTALPPGATAEKRRDNGILRPQALGMIAPPLPVAVPDGMPPSQVAASDSLF
jgi:hypothetical protein